MYQFSKFSRYADLSICTFSQRKAGRKQWQPCHSHLMMGKNGIFLEWWEIQFSNKSTNSLECRYIHWQKFSSPGIASGVCATKAITIRISTLAFPWPACVSSLGMVFIFHFHTPTPPTWSMLKDSATPLFPWRRTKILNHFPGDVQRFCAIISINTFSILPKN